MSAYRQKRTFLCNDLTWLFWTKRIDGIGGSDVTLSSIRAEILVSVGGILPDLRDSDSLMSRLRLWGGKLAER
jgi:hypothetical protein